MSKASHEREIGHETKGQIRANYARGARIGKINCISYGQGGRRRRHLSGAVQHGLRYVFELGKEPAPGLGGQLSREDGNPW
jgi:hypothetical protein